MSHETSLIVAVSAGVGLAFLFGTLATKLRLPPLLGYLMAGLAVGPFTPGLVADGDVAHQLSEMGVTLLMFGVGLHFSIKDLLAVRKIAVPGALAQIAVATLLGLGAASLMGMQVGEGIVFGLCLSVASTVVLLRALETRGETESTAGRIAVGWLIVEDIVTIVAIVLLPVLAQTLGGKEMIGNETSLARSLIEVLLKVTGFIGLMLIAGKRVLPQILGSAYRNGPRELFTVGVVAVALALAFGSAALFNISPALGAFLAGVVLSESELSHQTAAEIKSLSTVFAVLFFVSIGMLFDPRVLLQHPLEVVVGLLIVIIGKSAASAAIMLLFKHPPSSVLMVSASLAQIGELSFILAGIGLKLEIISQSLMSIILAVGVVSIALNPLVFSLSDKIGSRSHLSRGKDSSLVPAKPQDHTDERPLIGLKDHVVMVGFGRVGRIVARCLDEAAVPYVVIDFEHTIVSDLRSQGVNVVYGDGSKPSDLQLAGLEWSSLLVVATPANSLTREIVEAARSIREDIPICVRTHSFEDYCYFEEQQIQRTVLAEMETALEIAIFAFQAAGVDSAQGASVVEKVRSLPQEPSLKN